LHINKVQVLSTNMNEPYAQEDWENQQRQHKNISQNSQLELA